MSSQTLTQLKIRVRMPYVMKDDLLGIPPKTNLLKVLVESSKGDYKKLNEKLLEEAESLLRKNGIYVNTNTRGNMRKTLNLLKKYGQDVLAILYDEVRNASAIDKKENEKLK